MASSRIGLTALACFACPAIGCNSIPPGRSSVDEVTALNLHVVPASDIEDRLATAASPKFLGLFRGVVYEYNVLDESTLQRDLARVERYLRGHGFLDAKARAGRIVHTSKNHVRVEIVVDEGPPTLNRNIDIQGTEGLPKAIADAVSTAAHDALPKGERFDEDGYRKAEDQVKRALTDHGYAYAKVRSTGRLDPAAHVADYVFTISPGSPCMFGAIKIVGLDPDGNGPRKQEIPESAVRRALDLKPGEAFSSAKIDSATQALLDLGVFSSVEIVPDLPEPPREDHSVPLTVKVEPTRLRALKFGGGAEFDVIKTDLHLRTGWENHNFLGGLRDLTIDWQPGVVLYPTRVDNLVTPTNPLPEERFRTQLRQPGFIEARTTGFVQPEFNVFPLLVEPNPPANAPVVGYVEFKGTAGVDRTFFRRLYVNLSYSVQVEDPFRYIHTQELNSALNLLVLGYPQLITNLDFRDSAVRPHKGFYVGNTLQVAGGPFGGDARDVRVQPEVRTYVPLGKRVTFATRGSLGFLFALNYASNWYDELSTSDTVPTTPKTPAGARALSSLQNDVETMYFRGLFSGGPNTNRGFAIRGVAPYGVVPFLNPANASELVSLGCVPGGTNYNPANCFIPVGGFSLWELSNEFRFEVAGPFSVATFCDMGDVSPTPLDLRLDHLHLSCGFGARYDTPVGPIRFDLGYRVQPLQVIGFKNETNAANANPTNGLPQTIFGAPLAISIGIGEAF